MAHRRIVLVITVLAAVGANLPQLRGQLWLPDWIRKARPTPSRQPVCTSRASTKRRHRSFPGSASTIPTWRSSIAIWARASITCASPNRPCPTCVATSAAGRTSRLTTRRSWIAGSTRWSNCARKMPRPARRPHPPAAPTLPAEPAPRPSPDGRTRHTAFLRSRSEPGTGSGFSPRD